VLWGGVFLYVKESYNRETMTRYGHGTPDDWLERNVYSRFSILGITLMAPPTSCCSASSRAR